MTARRSWKCAVTCDGHLSSKPLIMGALGSRCERQQMIILVYPSVKRTGCLFIPRPPRKRSRSAGCRARKALAAGGSETALQYVFGRPRRLPAPWETEAYDNG